ncbi:MAG: hypothetical protein Q9218_006578 [Villophora microphyllina]
MASSLHLPPFDRDIRSASVPRLRHASTCAKYGRSPPTDAFAVDKADFPWTPLLGKPRTHLTSTQKYRIAQDSVGSLIGKHVNRHNQRTRENDPWRYWGPGRRWGKQEAAGKDVDTVTGVHIWKDEESIDWDLEMEAYFQWWKAQHPEWFPRRSNPMVLDPQKSNPMTTVRAKRDEEGYASYKLRSVRAKRTGVQNSGKDEDWQVVRLPEEEGESEVDDGWDLVSIRSAP